VRFTLQYITSYTKCRQTLRAMYGVISAVSTDETKFTPWLSSNATPLMCSTLLPAFSTMQLCSRSKPVRKHHSTTSNQWWKQDQNVKTKTKNS